MSSQSLKDAAVEFLSLVAAGQVAEAYDRHAGAALRHHNPHVRGDAASLKQAMQEGALRNPAKVLKVQRALQDGNEVAVFSHVRQRPDDPGAAVVHILRFEGGRIVELWDIWQPVPQESVNENGMF